MSALTTILKQLNPLFGDKKWNLDAVSSRTLQRWFNGDEEPSPAAARAVAAGIWRHLDGPDSAALRATVFSRIREVIPGAPCETWNQVSFAAWFFELAEGSRSLRMTPPADSPSNPFTARSAVSGPGFFGRENELRRLRDFVSNRQNLQIIGARRIGKSSLLREARERLPGWLGELAVAFMDMQFAAIQTLAGWLGHVAAQWQWPERPADFTGFSEQVEQRLKRGDRLVLLLDECESFIPLNAEFPREFFEGLRACGQMGLSIVTASRVSLRNIRERGGNLSPYYNTFAPLHLGVFTEAEAEAFVARAVPGLEPFSTPARAAILNFAGRHPLKLQIACYHVYEALRDTVDLAQALAVARQEWAELSPQEDGP